LTPSLFDPRKVKKKEGGSQQEGGGLLVWAEKPNPTFAVGLRIRAKTAAAER